MALAAAAAAAAAAHVHMHVGHVGNEADVRPVPRVTVPTFVTPSHPTPY